jgi:hypothetical protein
MIKLGQNFPYRGSAYLILGNGAKTANFMQRSKRQFQRRPLGNLHPEILWRRTRIQLRPRPRDGHMTWKRRWGSMSLTLYVSIAIDFWC